MARGPLRTWLRRALTALFHIGDPRSATLESGADMGTWRSHDLPWPADLPDPKDRPAEVDGLKVRWDGIRADPDRQVVLYDEDVFDSTIFVYKTGDREVEYVALSLRQRESDLVISLMWTKAGEPSFGRTTRTGTSPRSPTSSDIGEPEEDPKVMVMAGPVPEPIMRAIMAQAQGPAVTMRQVLRANYPNRDFSKITDKQILGFVESGGLERCGRCTANPADCRGPTCTFLREIGEDPVPGYRVGYTSDGLPDRYDDPNVDNADLAKMIRTAAFRPRKMPES